MRANIHYYYSTRHKLKPIRIEVEVSGGDVNYTMDVHGRFKTQREASEIGRDIGCRYDSYTESFGRITVEDKPPVLDTVLD